MTALKSFFLLCLAAFALSLSAKDINKYYVSSYQDNGVLYFVYPDLTFLGEGELSFDLTYLHPNDSVVLNFTYTDTQLLKLQQLSISVNHSVLASDSLNQLFVEYKKGSWVHRYSATFEKHTLYTLLTEPTPIDILLSTADGIVNLEVKEKQWKKQSEILQLIFQMIDAND